jgi:hypothetical protein
MTCPDARGGRSLVRLCSDKMQKTANDVVDGYRIVESFANRWKFTRKIMAHNKRGVCNKGGGGRS